MIYPSSTKRIAGLDALRAIAVLLVIKTHWGPQQFRTSAALTFIVKYIFPSGDAAVDFFFVLSGFLITGILLRSKQSSASNWGSLKTFIIRRSLRIFPVYFLFLFVLYAVNYTGIREHLLYYVTYTSNYLTFNQKLFNSFSHTWSLAVEEQFYLAWPILILFTPNKYLFKCILATIVLSTLAHVITEKLYGGFAYLLTINCFNAFAIGGLYAFALQNKSYLAPLKRTLLFLLPIAVALYIAHYFQITPVPLRLVHAIIALALIMRVTGQKYSRAEALIFENKILNSLGKISYGIYLFHYVAPYYYNQLLSYLKVDKTSSWFANLLYQPLMSEFIQFTFVVSLSYISFYVFETQFLKIKDLFKYKVKRAEQG